MFDDTEKDKVAFLSEVERIAKIRSNFSTADAEAKMKTWLKQDSRFDSYDLERLVKRVMECKAGGGVLEMSDPYLTKGGSRRPGDRRYAG